MIGGLGFGNWVGLNWTLRPHLSKVLHTPLYSTSLHKTSKIVLSVIYILLSNHSNQNKLDI